MAVGVIADGVAFTQHAFHQPWETFGGFAQNKKARADFVHGEQVEDGRGVDRVGAIVEGQAYQWAVQVAGHMFEVFKNSRRGGLPGLGRIQNHRIHCYAFCDFGIHQCETPRKNS